MNRQQMMGIALFGLFMSSTAILAQPAPNPPLNQVNDPTGTPPGVMPLQNRNSTGFPAPKLTPGQPIETREPEKTGNKPVFAGQTRAPYKASVPVKVEVLTDALKLPWSIAFLPNGDMLITEKGGTLRLRNSKGALSEPISGVPSVLAVGQVGLLDVKLDANFAASKRIFLSYSEPVGESYSNIAIASATLEGLALKNVKTIFRATPALPARVLAANSGGRMAIAKDGTIFMTVGDRSKSPPWLVAQRLDTNLGKMIHITAEGDPAPGNPFIGKASALPEIYSIGHRSEEGLTIDPATGQLWEMEHGARGGDELNKIEPGKNYGWPVISHGIDYPGTLIGDGENARPGMEQPRYYWDPVIAPSSLTFYDGNLFPQWKGSILIGALRGQMLDRLTMDGDKVVSEEPLLVDMKARIRDVKVGPEGAVYVISDDGRLMKVTPK